MKQYLLQKSLVPFDKALPDKDANKQIFLLSLDEFRAYPENLSHKKAALYSLEHDKYCKAELFGSCILGAIHLPIKQERILKRLHFGFYVQKNQLFLIGDVREILPLLGRIKETQFTEDTSVLAFFCRLLNSCLDDDIEFLQNMENKLFQLEDILQKHLPASFYNEIVPYRRDLMTLYAYYYQLVNLSLAIRSNINQMLTADDCLAYGNLAERVERLLNHVQTMREYLLQLREMYQTQLNIQQSKSMNIIAIVSVIFLPLTLLVGWYGMNFDHMPELHWKWGYAFIIVLSLVIVIVEILFFKRKKLL